MVTRLGQFLSADELLTVDARRPKAEAVNRLAPLSVRVTALPTLGIFQADPRGHQVQVITSACHTVAQAQDLIAILKSNP